MRFLQRFLFEAKSHLEYTLTIIQIVFDIPHSKQTPTNPSPTKEKMRILLDLLHNERMPPLLPVDGR
jgi:hypothetical protein